MCGFTGELSFNKIDNSLLKIANNHSVCRGPDNLTNYVDTEDININFWFNRLAIIDLSEKANQPMISKDSKSILMFNGEIYNSDELRKNLEEDGVKFRTSHSDTETLLEGLDKFGIEFINKLEGQFAFAYLNKNTKKIYLARDRLGQKPLYLYFNDKSLTFCSNLKSILEIKKDINIDNKSIQQYLAYGVNFAPRTLFKEIQKIMPATYLEIDFSDNVFVKEEKKYWEPDLYLDNKNFDFKEFQAVFSKSVSKRTVSDVPVATYLSGGIDSTSIVKKLNDLQYPINTFSVIVDNKEYNEKEFIDQVVNTYSTNHYEANIDLNISDETINKSIQSLDEPYSDPSVVPSYYLSELISKKYKVAISGDGGDELLGGYFRIKSHLQKKGILKNFISKLYFIYPAILGSGTNLKSMSNNYVESYISYLEDGKFFKLLFKKNIDQDLRIKIKTSGSTYKGLLKTDYCYYLSDQMMFKVDRTSMANSLEVRSPFVDHRLIEYIFSHDTNYFDHKIQKLPLRKYLSSDFDKYFLDRPKQGFVFDYKNWVFSHLDDIYDVINSSLVKNYINTKKLYRLHLLKTRINSLRIWRVYVLACYLNDISDS